MDPTGHPLNFSVGFHNVEGLHSDCDCFLPDITNSIYNDINFLLNAGTVSTKKNSQVSNTFMKRVSKHQG